MKNIRIWMDKNKVAEAVWLSQLLSMSGCMVHIDTITNGANNTLPKSRFRYVDILLLEDDSIKTNVYSNANTYLLLNKLLHLKQSLIIVSGSCLLDSICCMSTNRLDLLDKDSVEHMLVCLSRVLYDDTSDRKAFKQLSSLFTGEELSLSQSIYTVSRLFGSRILDYSNYKTIPLLKESISNLEKAVDYLSSIEKTLEKPVYSIYFSILYLQCMVNDGYIKLKQSGGYDACDIQHGIAFLTHNYRECLSVWFLKLYAMHNLIDFFEKPEMILQKIEDKVAPEYINKANMEVGDLYREDPNLRFKESYLAFYENIDTRNIENLAGIYRSGLVFESLGNKNNQYFSLAKERFELAYNLANSYSSTTMSPFIHEYMYKAYGGIINTTYAINERCNEVAYNNCIENLVAIVKSDRELSFVKHLYAQNYEKAMAIVNENKDKYLQLSGFVNSEDMQAENYDN